MIEYLMTSFFFWIFIIICAKLEDNSVDVAVYCLSLIGKDKFDYLIEAHRVVKTNIGQVHILESTNRIKNFKLFQQGVEHLGFNLTEKTSVSLDGQFSSNIMLSSSSPSTCINGGIRSVIAIQLLICKDLKVHQLDI